MMRFKSNDPPFGMGGLGYKPIYNQRFITGGMVEGDIEGDIEKTIDLAKYHMYKNKKSLLTGKDMINLKKEIKENVKSPDKDTKVYIVNFSVNANREKPLKIIISQYTLTPKLALILKDGDRAQTFTYSLDELKKYKFKEIYIGQIINIIKKGTVSFKKMSIPISDILEKKADSNIEAFGLMNSLKTIDLAKFHLFKNNTSLLEEVNMTKLKKSIKENVNPPAKNTKVWVANFSVDIEKKNPFSIIIGQYTLTPKLALVSKEDDRVQTITFSEDELKKYKFKVKYIGNIIESFKNNKISFAKLSIPISDILEKKADSNIEAFGLIKKKQPDPESESDESSSDEEQPPAPPVKKGFTPEFTKFGNLTAGSKDTLVKLLERRTKIDPKVRASIRNAIKNNKCQSPEQFDNYQPKEKKIPVVKVKKVKATEPFYGIPPVPTGKHQASMLESAKANKINYWGLKKADAKVIESVSEKPKEKKEDLMIKMAGLRGTLSRIKKEIEQAKTANEKQAKMTEFESKRQEILAINEQYQKMT